MITISSCRDRTLSAEEKKLAIDMEVSEEILQEIKPYFTGKIEAFHYSHAKELVDGKWIESDTNHHKGISIYEKPPESSNRILLLKDRLREKGYSIFLMENNFGIEDRADLIGILKTTDSKEILRTIGTEGSNYDISNDSLIQIYDQLNKEYVLELIGAGGDWCEFIIQKEPHDFLKMAKDIYAICPDIVDQGTTTIEALAEEMNRTKRLYLWWD